MSNCHCKGKDTILFTEKEGKVKDTVTFVSKEDHQTPSTVKISKPEPIMGIIRPDGSINWSCPCVSKMATGPCNVEFREAFSCFYTSPEQSKGTHCTPFLEKMRSCIAKYPTVYELDDGKGYSLSAGDINDNNISRSELKDYQT